MQGHQRHCHLTHEIAQAITQFATIHSTKHLHTTTTTITTAGNINFLQRFKLNYVLPMQRISLLARD